MGVWKALADSLQKKMSDQAPQQSNQTNDPQRSKAILERVTYDNLTGKKPQINNYIYGLEEKGPK